MYKAHIEGLRKIYKRKGSILNRSFRAHLPLGVTFTGANSGFYSTIQLPLKSKAEHLVNALKKKNILVQNATGMYLPRYKKENVIRLSVSQIEEKKIEEGIRRIGVEIDKHIRSPKKFSR